MFSHWPISLVGSSAVGGMRAIANGTIGAGGSVTSEDAFSNSYRPGTNVDLTQIRWGIEFTDDLGTRYVIRSVPQ